MNESLGETHPFKISLVNMKMKQAQDMIAWCNKNLRKADWTIRLLSQNMPAICFTKEADRNQFMYAQRSKFRTR